MVSKLKVSKSQREYLKAVLIEATGSFHEGAFRLLCHLVSCSREAAWEDDGYTPLSARLLEPLTDDRNTEKLWKPLGEAGLLEVLPQDRLRGLSRDFRLDPAVYEEFLRLAPQTTEEAIHTRWVDLVTGRPCNSVQTSRLSSNGNAEPPLIVAAKKTLKTGYYNDLAIMEHLLWRERLRDEAEETWRSSNQPKYTPDFEEFRVQVQRHKGTPEYRRLMERWIGDRHTSLYEAYLKARGQYVNDKACYDAIQRQRPRRSNFSDIYEYGLSYDLQMSGRLGQSDGGLQSCTREMKKAAYSGIPDLHNYDLRSSQPRALSQLLDEAGIECPWLKEYISDKDAKKKKAIEVGVLVDTWKTCLCAHMMGGYMPQRPASSRGAILRALRSGTAGVGLGGFYERLKAVLAPLTEAITAWHQYLVTDYLNANGYWVNGKRYIRNAAGMVLVPEDTVLPHQRKARMAAFLLQGLEAEFVHRLTALSGEYGFIPISNEHDGLVTIGVIPQAAVDRVKEDCQLQEPELDKKDFC